MSKKSQDGIDYKLLLVITQVSDGLMLARESEVKQFGITAVQAKVLGMLINHGRPVTIAGLSRRLQRKHNGVTALVNRMKKDGLLYTESSEEFKGQNVVGVTDRGEEIYGQVRNIPLISAIFSHLTNKQKHGLIEKMLTLRSHAVKELHAYHFFIP